MQEPISISHGIISRCLVTKEQLFSSLVKGLLVRDRQAKRSSENQLSMSSHLYLQFYVWFVVCRETLLNQDA
jgi:hypothetical protein